MSSNKKDDFESLPFNTEKLLEAVKASSERSRGILLLIVFTCILTLMALVNSFKIKENWFKSKIEVNKDVLKYFVFPNEHFDTANVINKVSATLLPLSKMSEYIIQNERQYNHSANDLYLKVFSKKMDSLYPIHPSFRIQNPKLVPVMFQNWQDRKEKYEDIGQALNLIYNHQITERQTLVNLVSALDNSEIEYLSLIRVPILGISFHSNYLGIYSGLLITILLILFYFSLFREKINLKVTFKRGWKDLKHHRYYLYEYASMQQVLSVPKKLFTAQYQKNKTYHLAANLAIVFPFLVYTALLVYNFLTVTIGLETNKTLTITTLGLSVIILSAIFHYSRKIYIEWKALDSLWDDQAYQLNLEFILGALHNETDGLNDLYPTEITSENLKAVKSYWYYLMIQESEKKRILFKRNSIGVLKAFINGTLDLHFLSDGTEIPKTSEVIWGNFDNWVKNHGNKTVSSKFRKEFYNMVDGCVKVLIKENKAN